MKECPNCNVTLPEGSIFCNRCGQKLVVTKTSDKNNSELVELVKVKGGELYLGSDESDDLHFLPKRKVKVNSFYISKYLVTQELFSKFCDDNPSDNVDPNNPVEMISWYDAIEFCNILSKKEGLTPCYIINKSQKDANNKNSLDSLKWEVECDFSANGYRLPTEAEWEYAARGGQESKGYKYAGSDDLCDVAHSLPEVDETQNVGTLQPNELGIYDMSGNVSEWCWDWFGFNIKKQNNPTGCIQGYNRVIRGGSIFDWGFDVSYRDKRSPETKVSEIGMRLVRSIPEEMIDDYASPEKGLSELEYDSYDKDSDESYEGDSYDEDSDESYKSDTYDEDSDESYEGDSYDEDSDESYEGDSYDEDSDESYESDTYDEDSDDYVNSDDFEIEDGVLLSYHGRDMFVTIPDCVTKIGTSAFIGNGYIVNVTIPDSVNVIGNGAFYNCEYLTDIIIPDSVRVVGLAPFHRCSHLEPSGIDCPSWMNKEKLLAGPDDWDYSMFNSWSA